MTAFPHGVDQAWKRLKLATMHPFSVDPEAPDGRLGIVDISHAYSNLWVEIARAYPHWFGRAVAWSSPLWVMVPVMLLVGWVR